jgi:hypothetical protein
MTTVTMVEIDAFRKLCNAALEVYRKNPSDSNALILNSYRTRVEFMLRSWWAQGCKDPV